MDVLAALKQPPLAAHLDKSWTAHITAKAGMCEAQAIMESGSAFHAEDQIASEIARLRVRGNGFQLRVAAPAHVCAGVVVGAESDLRPAFRASTRMLIHVRPKAKEHA